MGEVTLDKQRQQLKGELGREALSILQGLRDEGIDPGRIPIDGASPPAGPAEAWTVERAREALADAALERPAGELRSRERQPGDLTLTEVGERPGVSRSYIAQLERSDANSGLKAFAWATDLPGFVLVVGRKPRGQGAPLLAERKP